MAVTINREKSDQSLEKIFNKHGSRHVGKYFNKKKLPAAGFNWKYQRDFVELLMRDREDSLQEHKSAREEALKELDEKADMNRKMIEENRERIGSGLSGQIGKGE